MHFSEVIVLLKRYKQPKDMKTYIDLDLQYIDMSYLEEMSDGCEEFICEISEVFVEQMPQLIQQMRKHLAERNIKEFHKTVHKAKSSIKIMGIKPLINDIHEIEKDKTSENYLIIELFIEKFDNICNKAIEEVKEILNRIDKNE